MKRRDAAGFTLVEVLVALMVVALGLAALMTAVSSTARTSGHLRDKTLAQWIALNRIAEVRLTTNRTGQSKDTGEVNFAGRTWHYDTRYFDTSVSGVQRIVVRVWAGDAKSKSNPVTEAYGFLGNSLSTPGASNTDWTVGTTPTAPPCPPTGRAPNGLPCTPGAPGAGQTPTPPNVPGNLPGRVPTNVPDTLQ